jgi:Bacterial Ig domain/Domain of unknown function (DUF4124)
MFKKPLSLALLLTLPAIGLAATPVYKTVNPDGSISYSDESTPSAEVMMVEPVPTVPAYIPPPSTASETKDTEKKARPIYSRVSIVAPPNGETFHSGSGNLEVKVDMSPDLRPNHRVKIEIDGNLVTEQRKTSFSLSNVDRGTHTLTATILDDKANELATASTTFTLHRPTIKKQPRAN